MSSNLPDPPTSPIHPLLFTWEKKRPFVRCHSIRYGPLDFNPGRGRGRFHPFVDIGGKVVPTLYAADYLEGALSETVFRDVPVRGPFRKLGKFVLEPIVASTLICSRDLTLVQLFGFGLRRLGVTRMELIEAEADEYPRTTAWARALHACDDRIDGLIWVSRQNDGTHSLVLFGDRVPSAMVRQAGSSLALRDGPGFDEVQKAAEKAGILILA